MKYTNILEKILCVGDIIFSNWIYVTFIGLSMMFLLLALVKLITKKHAFIAALLSHIALLGYTIAENSKQLGKIWNNLVDNLFTNIYFPSTYTYLFVLIVLNVSTFVTLMKAKAPKVYKWINGIFFFIMQFIMILILELLSKNKIDIFSKTSLFSNKDLVMLLELSINIFIIWLIVITFTYLTNLITEKVEIAEEEPKEIQLHTKPILAAMPIVEQKPTTIVSNPQPVVQTPAVATIENTNKFIPSVQTNSNVSIETTINGVTTTTVTNNNTQTPVVSTPTSTVTTIQNINTQNIPQTNNFNLNELIPQKQEPIIPTPSEVIFEKILNNDLPVIKEEKKAETNQYTLNDYRLFNKILKEIKEYNHDNNVTIDKNLEYRLITKYSTKTFNMFKGMLKIYSN